MAKARTKDGRFVKGCAPGPGRPSRAVESQYLATLNDAVTIADWRKIVLRAVKDATAGDSKAREWLSKFVLGSHCGSLKDLAASEQAQVEKQSPETPQPSVRLKYKILR